MLRRAISPPCSKASRSWPGQEKLARDIAGLQAAEKDIRHKMSVPPPQAAPIPAPKPMPVMPPEQAAPQASTAPPTQLRPPIPVR